MSGRTRSQPRREGVVIAALGLLVLVATSFVALRTARGQSLDQAAMKAVSGPPQTVHAMAEALSTVSVATVALALAACLVLALARRRVVDALGAVVLVVGANVLTQLLKYHLLQRAHHGVDLVNSGQNSLPSGHTTVAVSFALAALLIAPRAWRSAVCFLGALAATLVGAGTVIAQWHRPSDVVAAVGTCALCAGLTLVLVSWLGNRGSEGTRQGDGQARAGRDAQVDRLGHLTAWVGAGVVGALIVSWGVRPAAGGDGLLLAVACLGSIGVACALLIGAFAQAVSHRG